MMRSDWDAYRAAYPTMTYADVAAFHRRVWTLHPNQDHYTAERVERFFLELVSPSVVELGGWRGGAAARILAARADVKRWDNYEICRDAADRPVTEDPRYRATWPERWPWETALDARHDTAVLAHVVEHMSADQLALAVAWLADNGVRHAYVEAPLLDIPRSWRRQTSAHVLGIGWAGVSTIFARHGLGVRARFANRESTTVFYGARP